MTGRLNDSNNTVKSVIFSLFKYLFIWLLPVLVVARGSFVASCKVSQCGAQTLVVGCGLGSGGM